MDNYEHYYLGPRITLDTLRKQGLQKFLYSFWLIRGYVPNAKITRFHLGDKHSTTAPDTVNVSFRLGEVNLSKIARYVRFYTYQTAFKELSTISIGFELSRMPPQQQVCWINHSCSTGHPTGANYVRVIVSNIFRSKDLLIAPLSLEDFYERVFSEYKRL